MDFRPEDDATRAACDASNFRRNSRSASSIVAGARCACEVDAGREDGFFEDDEADGGFPARPESEEAESKEGDKQQPAPIRSAD